MNEVIQVGDRVRILLDSKFWISRGWFEGSVVRIDPYSEHRNFYWIELDQGVEAHPGGTVKLISIFNPKKIKRV